VTVQELRETLTRLVELLQAADAKAATTKGLTEFVELTAGFDDLTLKAFVRLAEVGQNPPTPKATATPKPKSGGKSDREALAAEIRGLYERVADPAVTEEQLRTACGRLGPLAKDALVRVAEGVGLQGMKAKTKNDIVAAITGRLLERKEAAIRRHLVDRPPPPGPQSGFPPTGS